MLSVAIERYPLATEANMISRAVWDAAAKLHSLASSSNPDPNTLHVLPSHG